MRMHALLFLVLLETASSASNASYLELTAIVSQNNESLFECWRIAEPFLQSSQGGIDGAKALTFSGDGRAIYTVIPPHFDGGLHNAPVPQIVAFVSGAARITLPGDSERPLWAIGGQNAVLIAADTVGTGHITTYPSEDQTVAIQFPFAGGLLPAHEVIHGGQCQQQIDVNGSCHKDRCYSNMLLGFGG